MKQIQEVQMWRQVRGLAGAVMCETRDRYNMAALAYIDFSALKQELTKKMLVQRDRSVYLKKWAAKHEHEEQKEGVCLEPAPATLRKIVREDWTEKAS